MAAVRAHRVARPSSYNKSIYSMYSKLVSMDPALAQLQPLLAEAERLWQAGEREAALQQYDAALAVTEVQQRLPKPGPLAARSS